MKPEDNDLIPESEDAPAPSHHPKLASMAMSAGVVIAIVTIIICSYLLFNLFQDNLEPSQTTELGAPTPPLAEDNSAVSPQQPVAQLPPIEITEAPPPEPPAPPLPELNNSDEQVRNAAIQLNPAEEWASWVTTDEALRKFVVVVDNIAAGKIARKYLPLPKPDAKFQATQDGINYYLDNDGFARYSPYVRMFNNIDTDMLVKVYQRYSPLLEEAFAELGYADLSFHDRLLQAFDVVLEAPVIKGKVELIRPSVYYKFLDAKLEKSPAVHKQLIRMGPQNTEELQLKIQQLKTALSETHQNS